MTDTTISLRQAVPSDYSWIIDVVDEWWGRPMTSGLPKLFLDHFYLTSSIAESFNQPVGFLVGFDSPSVKSQSYIHYVAVAPSHRGQAVAQRLYERFFEMARGNGRTEVAAITASFNVVSINFHKRLGFSVSPPIARLNEFGEYVCFSRSL